MGEHPGLIEGKQSSSVIQDFLEEKLFVSVLAWELHISFRGEWIFFKQYLHMIDKH
jgi:hypothetical protein